MISKKLQFFEFLKKAIDDKYKYIGVVHEFEGKTTQCIVYIDGFINTVNLYENMYDDNMNSIHFEGLSVTKIAYANNFAELEEKLELKKGE